MFINKRLIIEYRNILKIPIPNILTHPLEENILEWHYAIYATKGDYRGGCYHGKLVFPEEYPMKPPKIYMFTPSGRFETNTRLCLSISDFHPETWNPSWNVEKILLGLYSFMLDDEFSEGTIGSIKDTSENRQKFAINSIEFNLKNSIFRDLFSKIQKNPKLDFEGTKISDESNIEPYCRYCIEKDGELIAPCKCSGSNKWVHAKCLAKWQYTSIISQSTHPKYQTNIETKCNVCLSSFNTLNYKRDELMLEFTGLEIAAMINKGYYIVSGIDSSKHNHEIMNKYQLDEFKNKLNNRILKFNQILKESCDEIKFIRFEFSPYKKNYFNDFVKLLNTINNSKIESCNIIIKLILHHSYRDKMDFYNNDTKIKLNKYRIETYFFDEFSDDWKYPNINWYSILK